MAGDPNGPFTIRVARPADATACARIYAPFVSSTAVSFEEEPPDEREMVQRIATTLETLPWLVATIGDETTGYAYASPHRPRPGYRWAVDVSVYVDERVRGRGIGRALYAELLAILERLGYRRVYAGIALPNPASEALHRAAGFEPIATYERVGWKLGAWHDVMWLGQTLGPDDDNEPPVPERFQPVVPPK